MCPDQRRSGPQAVDGGGHDATGIARAFSDWEESRNRHRLSGRRIPRNANGRRSAGLGADKESLSKVAWDFPIEGFESAPECLSR